MNVAIARNDRSVVGNWWWTVDHWLLIGLILLVGYGAVLTFAAGPPAAARIKIDIFHFVRQQLVLIPVAVALMIAVSLLPARWVRRLAVFMLLGALALTVAATFAGPEIKGARRWIFFGGFSLQPSELIKPAYAVFAAWMFSTGQLQRSFPGGTISAVVGLVILGVLLMQPDIGQAVILIGIWFSQLFLAGLSMIWVAGLVVGGLVALYGAYLIFPHVASRIDRFLDPATGDGYQIGKALDAFRQGGLTGVGPGEGSVKSQLPDAHADFIFAVAGEEFGLIACILILLTYAFIVLRGFARAAQDENLFILFATTGLLVGFGLQALINMASTLHMIPTKGMTLPFISYGGSSLIALAIGMGMVLALTRKRRGVRL
jgi:cell division protein FtsW